MTIPRSEVEAAFTRYWTIGAIDERWDEWSSVFTDDVHYVEHIYGEMRGKDTVHAWITKLMKDNTDVHAVIDWFMIDGARVVVNMQNRYYHPDPSMPPLDFPGITILHYAGNGLFDYEEDYWCLRSAKKCYAAFQAAVKARGDRGLGNGRFETLEAERRAKSLEVLSRRE
jgi:hypothetical protein